MAMAAVLVFIIAAFFKAATDSLGADADLERDRLVKEAQQAQVGKDPLQVEEGAPCVDFGRHTGDLPETNPLERPCTAKRFPNDAVGLPRDPYPDGSSKGREDFKKAFDSLVAQLKKASESEREGDMKPLQKCRTRGNPRLVTRNDPRKNLSLMVHANVKDGGHWADHACVKLSPGQEGGVSELQLTTYRAYWHYRWNTQGERVKQVYRHYIRFYSNAGGVLTSVEGYDDGRGQMFKTIKREYAFGTSDLIYSLNDGSHLWASMWHQLLSSWTAAP